MIIKELDSDEVIAFNFENYYDDNEESHDDEGKKPATTAKPKQTASLELPKNPLAFEVLDLVSKQRSVAKKVEGSEKT